MRATQSNWCSDLDFLSLNHAPNSPELNALLQNLGNHRASCRESKRLKKSRSNWLNSGNALIQHLSEKCNFRLSLLMPGSAEAQVI